MLLGQFYRNFTLGVLYEHIKSKFKIYSAVAGVRFAHLDKTASKSAHKEDAF